MQTGLYQHFKGGYYLVTDIAKHSETGEEFVVYRGESGVWIRPTNMFLEDVDKDGYKGPRFKVIKNIEFARLSVKDFVD